MDQALLLIPVTMAAYHWGTHAGNRWYMAILVVLATRIQAQEVGLLQDSTRLPQAGTNKSRGAYRFEAFDCDDPEDVAIQNGPHECPDEA